MSSARLEGISLQLVLKNVQIWRSVSSSWPTMKLIATPLRPKRPPRPIRWMYDSRLDCEGGEVSVRPHAEKGEQRTYLGRQVIVDDERHLLDVDTAGEQVRGDEDARLAAAELWGRGCE